MKIAVVVLSVAVFVFAWYSWNLNSRLDDLEGVQQEPATVTDASSGESSGTGQSRASSGYSDGGQADRERAYLQNQIDSARQDAQRQIDFLQQQQNLNLFDR